MALKLGREILAESGGGRVGTMPRKLGVRQLDLFDQLITASAPNPSEVDRA